MKQFLKDNLGTIVALLAAIAIALILLGVMIDMSHMPIDHSVHEYVLLLTTGEHLTVQFERCETKIFWSSMYAVCGANTLDGVDETWRAAIVAIEEK